MTGHSFLIKDLGPSTVEKTSLLIFTNKLEVAF
jgi:hypothetical protein